MDRGLDLGRPRGVAVGQPPAIHVEPVKQRPHQPAVQLRTGRRCAVDDFYLIPEEERTEFDDDSVPNFKLCKLVVERGQRYVTAVEQDGEQREVVLTRPEAKTAVYNLKAYEEQVKRDKARQQGGGRGSGRARKEPPPLPTVRCEVTIHIIERGSLSLGSEKFSGAARARRATQQVAPMSVVPLGEEPWVLLEKLGEGCAAARRRR